jgi:hypothetical protein
MLNYRILVGTNFEILVIWDLKLKYYCAQENQDVKAHDVNNKAVKNKIQSFLWQLMLRRVLDPTSHIPRQMISRESHI